MSDTASSKTVRYAAAQGVDPGLLEQLLWKKIYGYSGTSDWARGTLEALLPSKVRAPFALAQTRRNPRVLDTVF